MSEKMLKFTDIGQQTPPKRSVKKRSQDFKEIYDDFINKKAKVFIKRGTALNQKIISK